MLSFYCWNCHVLKKIIQTDCCALVALTGASHACYLPLDSRIANSWSWEIWWIKGSLGHISSDIFLSLISMQTTVLEGGKYFFNSFKQILLNDLMQCSVLLKMSWTARLMCGQIPRSEPATFQELYCEYIHHFSHQKRKIMYFHLKKNFFKNLSLEQNHIRQKKYLFKMYHLFRWLVLSSKT